MKKVQQYTYKTKTRNFLSDFTPKELFYIINNNSKYELKITTAMYVTQGHVTKLVASYVCQISLKG
jgi:hypothetical protein